jgi:hypothetical protein
MTSVIIMIVAILILLVIAKILVLLVSLLCLDRLAVAPILTAVDPEIRRRYPGGLLWVTVGQEIHDADPPEKINDLLLDCAADGR